MASCSPSPAAALEMQGGKRFFPGGGGTCLPTVGLGRRLHELSRSLRIEPRGMRCVARAALMTEFSSAAASTRFPLDSFQSTPFFSYIDEKERDEPKRDPVTSENLDGWLRDSIGEIVRHIGEAPFLVRIFSSGAGGAGMEREAAATATAEKWPRIRERWRRESRTPDGVILVEELKEEEEGGEKAWGLVVQGSGMDCAACYILNTCRVRSSGGFCTHFCLVRAKCFGETAEVQFRKAWLQGRR